jgi:hypothetical protein
MMAGQQDHGFRGEQKQQQQHLGRTLRWPAYSWVQRKSSSAWAGRFGGQPTVGCRERAAAPGQDASVASLQLGAEKEQQRLGRTLRWPAYNWVQRKSSSAWAGRFGGQPTIRCRGRSSTNSANYSQGVLFTMGK